MRLRLALAAVLLLVPIVLLSPLAQSTRSAEGIALVEAGRLLFSDPRLSEPPGTSCASCHDPARAFTGDNGSKSAVARGSRTDQFGTRNTPTLMYLATNPQFAFIEKEGRTVPIGGFFWDGRAASFADQARGPLFAANEMNNRSVHALAAKVRVTEAGDLLRRARGANVFDDDERAMVAVGAALAAFQQTPAFAPFTSKFDAVLRGRAKLTEAEERGQSLFVIAQKGNCASCHTVNVDSRRPEDSLFTDFTYHALGVPRNTTIAQGTETDQGVCQVLRPEHKDDRLRWCGWFKTPTLRNVALTAPYMHNGKFATLREAVEFYATRDTEPQRWYPNGEKFDDLPPALRGNVDVETRPYHRTPGRRPALNDEEIDDIVAFLGTLSDGYSP